MKHIFIQTAPRDAEKRMQPDQAAQIDMMVAEDHFLHQAPPSLCGIMPQKQEKSKASIGNPKTAQSRSASQNASTILPTCQMSVKLYDRVCC
jgi:hypothetical protein